MAKTDAIVLPPTENFVSFGAYFATAFHECAHSTGHESRLGRIKTDEVAAFGSETYAAEELVAEITSAMVCGSLGIITDDAINNSAAYLRGWRDAIANDNTLIVKAASAAQKAADMILGDEVSAA